MEKMKKIAFVPGAFRPFGDHHMKMAKHYSDMCDEVVLVVSNPQNDGSKRLTSNNSEISPEEAKSIIDLCLQDSGIKNITCQVSNDPNPIRTILRDISKLKDCSVVLGVSSKDEDQDRYDSIDQDYFKNNNVRIIPPNDTAFSPVKDNGIEISASDIRNHISDKDMLRSYLPVYVEDDTFNKIYDILNGKSKERVDSHDDLKFGSQIFQNLLEDENANIVSEDMNCATKQFSDGVKKVLPDSSLEKDVKYGLPTYKLMYGDREYGLHATRDFHERFRVYDSSGKEVFRCEYPSSSETMEKAGIEFAKSISNQVNESSKNLDFIEIDEEDTEFSGIRMNDSSLGNAKCSIMAYETECNRESSPDKAVDMLFEFQDGNNVEIFLNPETKEWDSRINGIQKLTPDQMGEFFGTDFCRRVSDKLSRTWSSDAYLSNLLEAVKNKKICLDPCGMMTEDGEFRKGNIDKERSRGKNAAGEQIYTNSGRKIVSFSDFGVKHDENEAYFVWPEFGKEFKWSQWADWKKIHPLLRMRFTHLSYTYGLSMSPLEKADDNRGFRSYNLDLEPKLQYCTPMETAQMMDLTIVQKFLKNAYKRLKRFITMPDDEIMKKIGRPDKIDIGDIRKTKHVIKNSLPAIRDGRADTYIYT